MSAAKKRTSRPNPPNEVTSVTIEPYLLAPNGVLQNRLTTLDVTVEPLNEAVVKLQVKDMWSSQSVLLTTSEAQHLARLLTRQTPSECG